MKPHGADQEQREDKRSLGPNGATCASHKLIQHSHCSGLFHTLEHWLCPSREMRGSQTGSEPRSWSLQRLPRTWPCVTASPRPQPPRKLHPVCIPALHEIPQKSRKQPVWGAHSLQAPTHLFVERLHRLLEGLGHCSLMVTEDRHSPVRPIVS